ncbi:MAG: O-antigen ligase family protein, partial [Patescibacteria group bacterium]
FLSSPAVFVLFAVLLVLYFSLKNPLNGVLFLAVYLPFETFLLKFVPEEIYVFARFAGEGLIVLMVLLLCFQYLTGIRKFKYRKSGIDLIVILFLVIGLISIFYNSVELSVGLLSLRQLLRYALVFYLIIYLGADKKFVRKFVIVMAVVLVVQAGIGLSQLILPQSYSNFLLPSSSEISVGGASLDTGSIGWDASQRVSGTFGRYDKLGIFLSFFLILAIGIFYSKHSTLVILNLFQDKILWSGIFLIGLLALIFTFSRLSWLGLILGLIWIGIILKKDKKIIVGFIFVIFILIIYFGIYIISTGFNLQRYEETPSSLSLPKRVLQSFSKYELQNSYYGYGRIFFWVNTPLRVVKYSPLIGVGPGTYGSGVAASLNQYQIYEKFGMPFGVQDRYGQIDNNWMSLWGEYGTIGLLLWLGLFFMLYRETRKIYLNSKDNLTKGLTLGFMGILIIYPLQSFFGPYFEVRTISFYFWTTAGILIGFRK